MNASTRAAGVLLVAGIVAGPRLLAAQNVTQQFTYDNLRVSGLQADLGALGASKLRGTVVGGVRLDIGQVAPSVRVLLGLSYDRGELDQHTTADLRRKIASLVQDPDSNFTINVGRIFWSDLTGDVDLQYVLPQGKSVTTYLGVGMGVHVRKGSGKAIDGTFVADAMGGVDAGLNATIAAEFATGSNFRFTLDARGVVASQLSTVSLRGGLMYRFAGR